MMMMTRMAMRMMMMMMMMMMMIVVLLPDHQNLGKPFATSCFMPNLKRVHVR
jgi:hypothetical protein